MSKFAGVIATTFTGNNGAGACSCTGLEVGDIVLCLTSSGQSPGAFNAAQGSESHWETVISVADEIQQIGGEDFSALTLSIVVARPSS